MLTHRNEREEKLAEHICVRYGKLESKQVLWKSLWERTAEYCLPRQKDDVYGNHTKGQARENKLFDSTGVVYSLELASFLFSMVVDPSTKFFELTTGQDSLDSEREVSLWLQDTARTIRRILSNSNFSKVVFETFIDLVVYGTGTLRAEPDEISYLKFKSYPIFRMLIDQDSDDEIDTCYRIFKFSAKQLIEKFPDRFNDQEKHEMLQDGNKEYEIIHAIEKRELFYKKDAKGLLPYSSYYVLKENKVLLNDPIEGFKRFPLAVPRFFKTSDEIYGRSPAQAALSDLMSLNVLKKAFLQGVQLLVAPPLQVEDNSLVRPLRFRPFSVNYRRPSSNRIEPLLPSPKMDLSFQAIDQLRGQITQAFFLDKIRSTDKTHLTQRQVFNLEDQQMKALGAILARFHTELLKPIIEIAYLELEQLQVLSPAPDVLKDANVQIRFTSQIARAQQLNEVQAIQQAIGSFGPILQIKPEAVDIFNADEASKIIFEALGVDKRVINDTESIEMTRQARQQGEQQQQEQQEAESLVNAVSKLGLE